MNEILLILVAIFATVALGVQYRRFSIQKDRLENFPRFFQEVHNNCASGMSLIDAVRKSRHADYGRLTPLIRNLCLQIEWGVPFPLALKNLGKKLNDKYINGIINLVEKTAGFSPDIGKSMDEIYNYIILTRELEKERSTALFPQLISIYMIFFVLLATIFLLFQFFLPSFGSTQLGFYKNMFSQLILVEAVLTGLATGKIVEGSFNAGLRHALILLCIGIFFIYFYNI